MIVPVATAAAAAAFLAVCDTMLRAACEHIRRGPTALWARGDCGAEGKWGKARCALTLELRSPHALQRVIPHRHLGVCDVPHAVHVLPDSSGRGGAVLRGLRGLELLRLVPGK